jgi:hypothetical protein
MRLMIAVCILVAVVVVVSVVLFVRSQSRKLGSAQSVSRRWQAHASAAQEMAAYARQQELAANRLTAAAVARTGEALGAAQEIRVVREQMDVLMGMVLGKHTEPVQHAQQGQVPRPGRHVLPEGRVSDLPPVL